MHDISKQAKWVQTLINQQTLEIAELEAERNAAQAKTLEQHCQQAELSLNEAEAKSKGREESIFTKVFKSINEYGVVYNCQLAKDIDPSIFEIENLEDRQVQALAKELNATLNGRHRLPRLDRNGAHWITLYGA